MPLLFLSWNSNRLQGETFLSKGYLPNSALDTSLLPLFVSPSSSKALCLDPPSTARSFLGPISHLP